MTVFEMAEDLAEHEYIHSMSGELLDLARQSLRAHWLYKAYRDPEGLQAAYNDMTGGSET